MLATQVIFEVKRLGASITVDESGENLIIEPGSLLTPELVDGLRDNKEFILQTLERRAEHQRDTSLGAYLRATRDRLRERAQLEDSSPPPPGGRSDKAEFFKGDWRETWPRDFKVYEGGGESRGY